MKKTHFLFTIILLFITNSIYAQYSSSKKSIVYIGTLEKNSTLIQYFNNEKLIGYTENKEYLMYECNPGKQLFWSKIVPLKKKSPKAESFLELDLESGKVYYLNTSTFTTNGKRLKKSVKKDKGNLVHQLVLLEDTYSINLFIEKISKKKPNTYKDKKLKKWNKELYSQITTSLYEYSQRNPIVSQNNNVTEDIKKNTVEITTKEEEITTVEEIIEENNTDELSNIIENASKTLEELEQSKLDAIANEDYTLANKLKTEINIKKEEELAKSQESNSSVEELEKEKQEAIENEDFMLANDLKKQIKLKVEVESKINEEIENLEQQKKKAVEDEDYELASKLKKQIDLEKAKKKSDLIEKETTSIKDQGFIEENDLDSSNKNNTLIDNLEKVNAITNEDYQLAEEIKKKIELKKEEKGSENNLINLKLAKEEAIKNEDYLLAGELKEKIKLREKENTLSKLQQEKEEAIANEDYILAGKIKKQIDHQNGISKEVLQKQEESKTKEENLNVLIAKNDEPKTKITYSNSREGSLALFTNNRSTGISNNIVTNYVTPFYSNKKTNKISKSNNNKNADVINYSRSSLYTLMVNNDVSEHAQTIKDAFGNSPLQEKFNDHNIGPYYIDISYQAKDLSSNITSFLNTNDIAREMVAKWFNRNGKGEFNMDLVAQRGNYDASALDISIAKNSERGLAMLADAGEELIKNTFIIVNDYKFTNKEEVAKKASKWLNLVSNVAAYVPGGSTVSSAATYTSIGVSVVGKGYVIKTTSYLYRLVWDEETANAFYNNYWIDKNNFDPSKKEAFDNSVLFHLELIGSENAWADIQSTIFTHKSNDDLIRMATVKATNKAIAKLQRKFEAFRTKSPLISGNPISAKIGLKEGLKKGDKYEVLEQVINKKGNTEYRRVGIIKVDNSHIWDNRFMADEINNSKYEYTTFKGSKNKFFAGMLIRQIN